MFEHLRDTLRGLSARLAPEERRRVAGSMRDALVHAKLALDDLRDAIRKTEGRLATERQELETVLRRGALAAQVGDQETVDIADRFGRQHADRVRVLETKLMAQQQELTLGEREYEDMRDQMRLALSGVAPSPEVQARDIMDDLDAYIEGRDEAPSAADGMPGDESPLRRRTRAEREADAEERLAALKRRMGK